MARCFALYISHVTGTGENDTNLDRGLTIKRACHELHWRPIRIATDANRRLAIKSVAARTRSKS